MPIPAYNLHLKGRVGGKDFDTAKVDRTIDALGGKTVSVLIDSTGGSLATGLSICAAFRRHGDVSVHFTGLNASAATIASLGARRITIDRGAAYLIHQVSLPVVKMSSMNADQFRTLIEECRKNAEDLDKLDSCIAAMYAQRCKKKPEDLYALMKAGGWLTPQEALEWGFVDSVTDYAHDSEASVDDALAEALADAGIPIPVLPDISGAADGAGPDPQEKAGATSSIQKMIDAAVKFFRPDAGHKEDGVKSNDKPMTIEKNFKAVCETISAESLPVTDGKVTLAEADLESIETAFNKLKTDNESLRGNLADALKNRPAGNTAAVNEPSRGASPEKSGIESYVDACNEADRILKMLG